MNSSPNTHLAPERLVFFSDAVVAIAITLLMLELKVEQPENGLLTWSTLAHSWKEFTALTLSFLLITIFWRVHYQFFERIQKVDRVLLFYNCCWLFCIALLPFSTSLLSNYFGQQVSTGVYAVNHLCIAFFQNQIWDYVAVRPDFLKEELDKETVLFSRIDCNVALLNTGLAAALAFYFPFATVGILFLNRPMILAARWVWRRRKGSN